MTLSCWGMPPQWDRHKRSWGDVDNSNTARNKDAGSALSGLSNYSGVWHLLLIVSLCLSKRTHLFTKWFGQCNISKSGHSLEKTASATDVFSTPYNLIYNNMLPAIKLKRVARVHIHIAQMESSRKFTNAMPYYSSETSFSTTLLWSGLAAD